MKRGAIRLAIANYLTEIRQDPLLWGKYSHAYLKSAVGCDIIW